MKILSIRKWSFQLLSVPLFVCNAELRIRILGKRGRKAMCALLLYILSFLSGIDHTYPILVSAQKIKRIRTKQLLDPRIDETVWHNYVTKGWVRSTAIKLIVTFMFWQKKLVAQHCVFCSFEYFFNFKLCKRYFTISLFVEAKKLKVSKWNFSMKLNDVSYLPEAMKRIPISTDNSEQEY